MSEILSTLETAAISGAEAAVSAGEHGDGLAQIAAAAGDAALPAVLDAIESRFAALEKRIAAAEADHPLLAGALSVLATRFPHDTAPAQ